MGHRPPGLRPQDRHRPPGRLRHAAPGRRPVGLPEPRRESEHDWIENSHASTILCYAYGLAAAARQRGATRPAPDRRGHRRRLDDRRHGLRGAQQPRPQRPRRDHRPQRQRPLVRADGVAALARAWPASASTRSTCAASARVEELAPRAAARRPPAEQGIEAVQGGRPRDASSRRRSSRRSACATSARSTATTSQALEQALPQRRRVRRARSSCTCSPRRAGATRRPRTTTRSACTTPPCSTRPSGRRRPCRRATPQAFTEAIIKEAEHASASSSPSPRRCPGPTGLLPFAGPLPRPLLRRRHRRAARRHRGRGHGHGRPAAGRRHLLDVPHPGLRPGQPRRRRCTGMPVIFCLDRAGITGDDGPSPPRRARHGAAVEGAGHDGVRAVVGPGAAADAARRPRADRRSGRDPLPEGPARQVGRRTRSAAASPARRVRAGRRHACASSPSASSSAAPRGGRARSPSRASGARCGTSGSAKPLDPAMIADAARHRLVVTVEDGVREGGVGAPSSTELDRAAARAEHRGAAARRGARHADRVHPPRQARPDPGRARARRRRHHAHDPRRAPGLTAARLHFLPEALIVPSFRDDS